MIMTVLGVVPGRYQVLAIPIHDGPTAESVADEVQRTQADAAAGRICAAAAEAGRSACVLLELLGEFDATNAIQRWTGFKSVAHWLPPTNAPGAINKISSGASRLIRYQRGGTHHRTRHGVRRASTNGAPCASPRLASCEVPLCGLDGEHVAAVASWSEPARRPHPVRVQFVTTARRHAAYYPYRGMARRRVGVRCQGWLHKRNGRCLSS
jgi:hypothetical protein